MTLKFRDPDEEEEEEGERAAPLFVKKWVDCSDKHGLGYLLSDDKTVGSLFNDDTSMIADINDDQIIHYIYKSSDKEKSRSNASITGLNKAKKSSEKVFKINLKQRSKPPELKKKIAIFQLFVKCFKKPDAQAQKASNFEQNQISDQYLNKNVKLTVFERSGPPI